MSEGILHVFQSAVKSTAAVLHPGACLASWWGWTAILRLDNTTVYQSRRPPNSLEGLYVPFAKGRNALGRHALPEEVGC